MDDNYLVFKRTSWKHACENDGCTGAEELVASCSIGGEPVFLADGHMSFEKCRIGVKAPKYKGRVVLRGDIVKDDSGSYAVFTEQESSASQMTASKVIHGYHFQTARLRRTNS